MSDDSDDLDNFEAEQVYRDRDLGDESTIDDWALGQKTISGTYLDGDGNYYYDINGKTFGPFSSKEEVEKAFDEAEAIQSVTEAAAVAAETILAENQRLRAENEGLRELALSSCGNRLEALGLPPHQLQRILDDLRHGAHPESPLQRLYLAGSSLLAQRDALADALLKAAPYLCLDPCWRRLFPGPVNGPSGVLREIEAALRAAGRLIL